jgi:epoxyqueuosine reductase
LEWVRTDVIKRLAAQCGFELAGVAKAEPAADGAYYTDWVERGLAGAMGYLTDHRAGVRLDPQRLLPGARSIICVGKLYNSPRPYSTGYSDPELGWISRYAWGDDYHDVLRAGLTQLATRLAESESFDYKICVDTAPLLERSYARLAGLGWIGKNTCLINQQAGSWFFLGELLTTLELEPDQPPPDRCGTCTRCIDACPTQAIVPAPRARGPEWELDARLCISYFTIELRGSVPEAQRGGIGPHVFGCDICQDVCPWNSRAPSTTEPAFEPRHEAPPLDRLAALTEQEFKQMFRGTPVTRARYRGFLRNVAVAMGNSGLPQFHAPLERLAASEDALVADHARWALARLNSNTAAAENPIAVNAPPQ